ncbi:hypothetical protein B0H19DRAFT_1339031 [Mycena capillaripes]|nr:hypothetical protein B0H19DRAFT_1339031 [Mycena capillaripes]
MADLVHKNVIDPSLREWILPKFSTTTTNDTTIGAMLMMATMKKYFDYTIGISCGIPRVTLEGERQDWELVLHRLEKLKEYGLQTIAWYHLLYPVISRFWSGWISAFCLFASDGLWQGRTHLTLDGTEYPVIRQEQVPSGYAEVDVKVDNNGAEIPCVIVAGFVGMGPSSSRDLSFSRTGKNDTLRPVLAWWIYSKLEESEKTNQRERASFLKRLFKI